MVQEGLFDEVERAAIPEPVLMALHAEFFDLIWQGLKTHEFRRRFLEGRPTRWSVYLNAPVSPLAAVIDWGPAAVDVPERISAIAEEARMGNGVSVLEYVKDLERAYAIPILRVVEYPGMSADELRQVLGRLYRRRAMPGSTSIRSCCPRARESPRTPPKEQVKPVAVEGSVVGHPVPYHRIDHLGEVRPGVVDPAVQPPGPRLRAHLLQGVLADRRGKGRWTTPEFVDTYMPDFRLPRKVDHSAAGNRRTGHGEYRVGSGETIVPEGTSVYVYAEHGGKIPDIVGLGIETGTGRKPVRIYGPGESIPNYTLKPPVGLTIRQGSHTVDTATSLSELLKRKMGACHWAACQEVR
ncbi:hypothetical protein Ssi03_45220 [Sphaerisporangium siamense]|uniref:Putative transcriptional regulator n=2 Tax=Sphaerisporangium siamense TaxID=795645 RepID=A0A7W7DET6_9ACTN|nr:hypothetical protein [Sphaerisporangium siamense]MBB4705316.1 putative transcriptional regulator [Sphaerisporangium siamense]GII86532.1 hypothetical protein Ssi03_45220 [Sphaerisporangium siamense]